MRYRNSFILRNLQVHRRLYKSSLSGSNRRRFNLAHVFTFTFSISHRTMCKNYRPQFHDYADYSLMCCGRHITIFYSVIILFKLLFLSVSHIHFHTSSYFTPSLFSFPVAIRPDSWSGPPRTGSFATTLI
jgi:hypothetical protein